LVLLTHENLSEDKHVESLLFPCLDEGSTPSSSTKKPRRLADTFAKRLFF